MFFPRMQGDQAKQMEGEGLHNNFSQTLLRDHFSVNTHVSSIFLSLYFSFSDFCVLLGDSATRALPHQVDRRTFSCVNISQRCQHQQG